MTDIDEAALVIEEVFTKAVERCEFNQVVSEDGEVDVSEVSWLAARELAERGLLS